MEGFYSSLAMRSQNCPEGCKACADACLRERGFAGIRRVAIPEVDARTLLVCRQCGEPRCMKACPTGAIERNKSEGIVTIDSEKCIGCEQCIPACPYGGIVYDEDQEKCYKCDRCAGREPWCVAACSEGILSLLKSRSVAEELQREDLVAPGVSLCAGCPVELAERITLKVLGKDLILFMAPGCAIGSLAGIEGVPQAGVSVYSCLMTNIASSVTGVKRYYQKIGKDVTCLCFVGDGATADIGFQALSGAAERGEKMVFLCYDNEAYMNTGIQRSSTTPQGSWTTTTSVGVKGRGKSQRPKNMPLIMLAHDAMYVATASLGYLEDYIHKLKKAKKAAQDGFAYIHLFTPCPTGWRAPTNLGIRLSRLAVETNYFPLWEAERGQVRMTYEVKKPKPIHEFTRWMGRFSHLTLEELREMQESVDEKFRKIAGMAKCSSF